MKRKPSLQSLVLAAVGAEHIYEVHADRCPGCVARKRLEKAMLAYAKSRGVVPVPGRYPDGRIAGT